MVEVLEQQKTRVVAVISELDVTAELDYLATAAHVDVRPSASQLKHPVNAFRLKY